MRRDDKEIQALLRHNTGFHDPDRWVDYARENDFEPVKATSILRCPDCVGSSDPTSWGQYVYYSTLIRLRECPDCKLIWADAHLDPAVVQSHFETAYKDEDYFRKSRNGIFSHLAESIDDLAPSGGRVIDIGGARGDLMAKVAKRRSDLELTVQDLSREATEWAAKHFGLRCVNGSAAELAGWNEQYDVAVLSDVLYYEPNLSDLWSALEQLIAPGGAIVIRLPNRAPLIRLGQWRAQAAQFISGGRELQDTTHFFNPEHIYILRPSYLRRRLKAIGFGTVDFAPSPLLNAKRLSPKSALFAAASATRRLTGGSVIITPSMVVTGKGKS